MDTQWSIRRFALKEGAGTGRRSLSWCKIVRQPLGRWEFLLFVGAGWGGRKYWAASPSAPDAATRKLHQVRDVRVCYVCVCAVYYAHVGAHLQAVRRGLFCSVAQSFCFKLPVEGGCADCCECCSERGRPSRYNYACFHIENIHFLINTEGLNNFKN